MFGDFLGWARENRGLLHYITYIHTNTYIITLFYFCKLLIENSTIKIITHSRFNGTHYIHCMAHIWHKSALTSEAALGSKYPCTDLYHTADRKAFVPCFGGSNTCSQQLLTGLFCSFWTESFMQSSIKWSQNKFKQLQHWEKFNPYYVSHLEEKSKFLFTR